MTRRPAAGQMTIGHADPSYAEVRRTVLAQVVTEWTELEDARRHATALGRTWGAGDRLTRARVRWAVVTDQTPNPAELAMAYRHGWLAGLEHLAPPNPTRTAPAPIDPTLARAMRWAEEAESETTP